jgi:hypothetical protein
LTPTAPFERLVAVPSPPAQDRAGKVRNGEQPIPIGEAPIISSQESNALTTIDAASGSSFKAILHPNTECGKEKRATNPLEVHDR